MRMQQQEPDPEGGALRSEPPDHVGYAEWDRREWVGEGQEPRDRPLGPRAAATEPRWLKWQWIGEGQGEPGPSRGRPPAAMPDGDNAYGGHRHNPGMEHWAGR